MYISVVLLVVVRGCMLVIDVKHLGRKYSFNSVGFIKLFNSFSPQKVTKKVSGLCEMCHGNGNLKGSQLQTKGATLYRE